MSNNKSITVVKNSTIVFAATFFGLGLNYLYGVVLARWFGAELFGIYSIGLSVFTILTFICVLGLDNAILRYVVKARVSEDKELAESMTATALFLGGLFCVILSLFLYIFAETLATRMYDNHQLTIILKIFSLAIPGYVISTLLMSVLQAYHVVSWRLFAKYVAEPIMKIIVTIVFVWMGWGIQGPVVALVIALALSGLIAYICIRKMIGTVSAQYRSLNNIKIMVLYSWPLTISLIFSMLGARSDILILGIYTNTFEVGIYSAAFMTAAIQAIVLQSIETTTAPHISEAVSRDNRKEIVRIYKDSLRWVLIITIPLTVTFVNFADYILKIFGEQYVAASYCLIILGIAQLVNCVTGSANQILLMKGKSKWVLANSFLYCATQIIGNLILIPDYGIIGAATVSLISIFVLNILRVIEVYILFNIQPYDRYLIKPITAGALSFIAIYIMERQQIVDNILIYIVLTTIMYFLFVFSLGLKKADRNLLNSIVLRIKSIENART